jgi:hypothetical protein
VHRRGPVFGLAASFVAVLMGSVAGPVSASTPHVWAVGAYYEAGIDHALIEFSSGSGWTIQPSPIVGTDGDELYGVTATSLFNAWAVGTAYEHHKSTLILHWDGFFWSRQSSPDVSNEDNELTAVSASSASNAWAVGSYEDGYRTLILHWDGSSWTRQLSPNPGVIVNNLSGVVAISATNAWAVGTYDHKSVSHALLLHWDGTRWNVVADPTQGSHELFGVAAASANDIWAVGDSLNGTKKQSLILRQHGTGWSAMPHPTRIADDGERLVGVTAISSTNAWAVGNGLQNHGGNGFSRILHWNGSEWKFQAAPQRGIFHSNVATGVAAASPSKAWMVGYWGSFTALETLILRWNGTKWQALDSPNVGDKGSWLNGIAVTTN